MPHTLVNLYDRLRSDFYNPIAVVGELILIAVAVNWCAGILQGTRGARLLRGLLIVLIVAALTLQLIGVQSDWARLDRLAVLLRYFIPGLAFVALVAFQPELRRALIRAGELTLMRRHTPLASLVATLVESAKYLSRNRYGALIAIQRDVPLGNWIETGAPINGEISARLLNTIFFPNSDLHDLGVVISGNRIVAANCQFPQAESGELDAALGSRHRAAVGLSQESDALVLVVSEESGAISLADRGKLLRFLSLDDLDAELTNRLSGYAGNVARGLSFSSSTLWRAARRMLVVLPLTIVLWFLADQASQVTAEAVQITVRPIHDGALHVEMERSTFSVTVQGPARAIDKLRGDARNAPFVVDWPLPRNTEPSERRQNAAALLESLPGLAQLGLSITSVDPPNFNLLIDRIVSVELPVLLDRGGLLTSDERLEPQKVTALIRSRDEAALRGASVRAVLQSSDEALRGAQSGPITVLAQVERRVNGIQLLGVDPAAVRVSLRIVGTEIEKAIEAVSVMVHKSLPVEQRYSVVAVDSTEWLVGIRVKGSEELISTLSASDILARVTVTAEMAAQKRDSEISALVELRLPSGVTLVGNPPQVRFKLIERAEPPP